ncbi:hypothetical protein [Glaciibacter superstes]|uniref:hypothetical protein n=1 Tax=Glaciibacter superstes TaxID=501023 RepID=UPI0003B4600A|nr:hypothetical protein [Glaciibacter superstes]
MRKSSKLITALGIAGLVAVAGTAFTATSTIDQANKIVGSTNQTISGVSVSSVEYTTDATTDTTTAVAFHVAEDLATTPATITASIGDGTTTQAATNCTQTAVAASVDPVVPASTDVVCTFAGLVNVIRLDISAS